MSEGEERTVRLDADGPGEAAGVVRAGDAVFVDVDGRSVAFRLAAPPDVDRAARTAAQAHGGGPLELVAPMPAQVLVIHAAVGDTVEAGDPIVTLEAMKMEHVVIAPAAGRLSEVAVRPAEQVSRGDRLATLDR